MRSTVVARAVLRDQVLYFHMVAGAVLRDQLLYFTG